MSSSENLDLAITILKMVNEGASTEEWMRHVAPSAPEELITATALQYDIDLEAVYALPVFDMEMAAYVGRNAREALQDYTDG